LCIHNLLGQWQIVTNFRSAEIGVASRRQELDKLHAALGPMEAHRRVQADYVAHTQKCLQEATDRQMGAERAGQPTLAEHWRRWAVYWQGEFQAASGWLGRMDTEIGQIKARIKEIDVIDNVISK
jgi:hypothetical protein